MGGKSINKIVDRNSAGFTVPTGTVFISVKNIDTVPLEISWNGMSHRIGEGETLTIKAPYPLDLKDNVFDVVQAAIQTPDEVFGSSLVAWWNSDRSQISLGGGGGILQWDDLSGNSYHFRQETESRQLGYGITTLNGKPVADLDGSQFMANVTPKAEWAFLHDGTLYTVLSVFKPGNVADPDEVYPLLGTSLFSTSDVGFSFAYEDRVRNPGKEDSLRHVVMRSQSGAPTLSNYTADFYAAANTWHHAEILADPSNSTAADRSIMTADGQAEEKNNSATDTPATGDPNHTLQLGMLTTNPGDGWLYVGQFAEALIILGHPTQSQLDWWNNQWTPYEWGL